MKYIGITGKKGIPRHEYAWIIANLLDNPGKSYQQMVRMLSSNEDAPHGSTDNVMLDSFAWSMYDMVKMINPNLMGMDLSSGYIKEKWCVNIGTLQVARAKDVHPTTIKGIHQQPPEDTWLTVGGYIMYITRDIFKAAFGGSFWVNNLKAMESLRGPVTGEYKIFFDVKTNDEHDFIKDLGGLIITLTYPTAPIGGYMVMDKPADAVFTLNPDMSANEEVVKRAVGLIKDYFSDSENH